MSVKPQKVADLTPENLKILIEDIGGPGWYASADLYRWYAGMAESAGLEPVTHRKFGGVLREMGFQSKIRVLHGKHTRCWLITSRALRPSPRVLLSGDEVVP